MAADWSYQKTTSSASRYVVATGYVQKGFEDRVSLDQTANHQHNLVISGLLADDEGLYVCIEDAGLGQRHQFQLTVHGQHFHK